MNEEKKVIGNENENQQEQTKTEQPVTKQEGQGQPVPSKFDQMSNEEKNKLLEALKKLLEKISKHFNKFTVYGHLEELRKQIDENMMETQVNGQRIEEQTQKLEEQGKNIDEIKDGLAKIISLLDVNISNLPGYQQQDAERLIAELKYNVNALMPDLETCLKEIFSSEYGHEYNLAFDIEKNELIIYNPVFVFSPQDNVLNLPVCLCIPLDDIRKIRTDDLRQYDACLLAEQLGVFHAIENGMDFASLSADEKVDYIKTLMNDLTKRYEDKISEIEKDDKGLFELEQDEHEIA